METAKHSIFDGLTTLR